MDRTHRTDRTPDRADRCQRIIDLIDACLAEHGMPAPSLEPAGGTVTRGRR